LLYIDDIVLVASSTTLIQHTISALKREFAMKDLRPLHHFLGVSVQHQANMFFLIQHQYALYIIECDGIVDCKPISMPVDTQAKVSTKSVPPIADLTQYLMFTHSNIAYVVKKVCLHMHDPREPHLTTMKRILHYLQGSLDFELLLQCDASSELIVYTDADWVGCPNTRQTTSCYAVFLSNNLVFRSSKCQNIVSHSSVKSEYQIVANGMAEACWLRQLL
jgi:hypothetical protein